jgi:hypothetical protein
MNDRYRSVFSEYPTTQIVNKKILKLPVYFASESIKEKCNILSTCDWPQRKTYLIFLKHYLHHKYTLQGGVIPLVN